MADERVPEHEPTTADTAPVEPEVTPVADPSDVTIGPEPGAEGGDSADVTPAPPGQDEPAPLEQAASAAVEPDAAPEAEPAGAVPFETDAPAAGDAAAAGDPTTASGDDAPAAVSPEAATGRPRGDRPKKPRQRRRPGGDRPRGPRPKVPLPFDDLRTAAGAVLEQFGGRKAVRDAFGVLGEKERRDLSRLVSEDGEWRTRARNIAAGSLGAGRVGKALAAQQVSMAPNEDVWRVALTKEEADQRLARIRDARQRDERRAERERERNNRADRVSREDMAKARDGRVGAQIRIVQGGTGRDDRRREGDEGKRPKREGGSSVLDRLGY